MLQRPWDLIHQHLSALMPILSNHQNHLIQVTFVEENSVHLNESKTLVDRHVTYNFYFKLEGLLPCQLLMAPTFHL